MYQQPETSLKAIGINIYGGGFTLGVLNHFQVLGQWEEITLGKRTFEMNFQHLIPRPLHRVEWPVKQYVGKAHLVYANPPCAPWSLANTHPGKTKESRFKDIRLDLTMSSMKTAVKLQPKVFISESVEAAYNIGKVHYEPYVKMWLKAGYAVTWFLTDALLHGAPCQRRRFHFIAHKYKLQLGEVPDLIRSTTVRDVIGELAHPRTFNTIPLHFLRSAQIDKPINKLFPYVPPGGQLMQLANRVDGYRGKPGNTNPSFLTRRLMWDAVSPTMVGFAFIHPDGERWITFREAMRLCTYPDSFMAHSPIEAVDAVIPTVANFLALTAKKTIEAKQPCAKKFTIVDWREHGLKWHGAAIRGKPMYFPYLTWKQIEKDYAAKKALH